MVLREHGIPVGLKWPDLMLCGRKLGGILTETKVQQGRITKAVVGVGRLTQYPKQASICYPSKQISLLYCLSGNAGGCHLTGIIRL